MGCGGSKHDARDKQIALQLKQDKRAFDNILKILLLGAGESGKSTIAKQFKILNTGNFTTNELSEFKAFIQENVKESMKALIDATETLAVPIDPENQAAAEAVKRLTTEPLDLTICNTISKLWKDPAIQQVFQRSNEFHLNDNAKYCLEHVERISQPDYVPTQEDALHTRIRTTGVIETKFVMGKRDVILVDVGGQRAERRKWMNCFDSVTAVIFCLALSEYDLKLIEDSATNRMHESLKIFEEVCNKWFPTTTIIIFLNKSDLFEVKIKAVPLTVCFPEYTEENEFEAASNYIRQKLLNINRNDRTRMYAHITCATNTDSIKVVFEAIKETIITASLKRLGMY